MSDGTGASDVLVAADDRFPANGQLTAFRKARVWVADMLRYLALRGFVAVADHTPRRVSGAGVELLAGLECLLSSRGRAFRAESRLLFGASRRDAFGTARRTIRNQYLDLLDIRRVSTGREDVSRWEVEEFGRDEIDQLLSTRTPFLIVGGHFGYAPILPLAATFPALIATGGVDPIEPFQLRGDVLLRRLMMGMVHGLVHTLRPGEVSLAYVGQEDVQTRLLRTLSMPGGVGYLSLDIEWKKPNAHVRPFCGYSSRRFALGAVRIARLAQVPLVLIVGQRTGTRGSRIHYSGPYYPPARADAAGDTGTLDGLVDELERYVARFREDYPHPLGWERLWSATSERWEPCAGAQGPGQHSPGSRG